jgi:hypothetical protein
MPTAAPPFTMSYHSVVPITSPELPADWHRAVNGPVYRFYLQGFDGVDLRSRLRLSPPLPNSDANGIVGAGRSGDLLPLQFRDEAPSGTYTLYVDAPDGSVLSTTFTHPAGGKASSSTAPLTISYDYRLSRDASRYCPNAISYWFLVPGIRTAFTFAPEDFTVTAQDEWAFWGGGGTPASDHLIVCVSPDAPAQVMTVQLKTTDGRTASTTFPHTP